MIYSIFLTEGMSKCDLIVDTPPNLDQWETRSALALNQMGGQGADGKNEIGYSIGDRKSLLHEHR